MGFFLFRMCFINDLVISNIMFCLFILDKILQMFFSLKYWYFIDYIIVREKNQLDM